MVTYGDKMIDEIELLILLSHTINACFENLYH